MSRLHFVRILTWLVLCLIPLFWVNYNSNSDSFHPGYSALEASAQAAPQSPTQGVEITITNEGFDPAELAITLGTTVTWRNATTQTLTLTSGDINNLYLPTARRDEGGMQAAPASGIPASRSLAVDASTADNDTFLVTLAPGAVYSHAYLTEGLQNVFILELNLSAFLEILFSFPPAVGVTGRLYANVGTGKIFVPDIDVYLKKVSNNAESLRVHTNLQGQYWFPRKAAGDYQICWEAPGYVSACHPTPITIDDITVYAGPMQITPRLGVIQSKVLLADETPCRMFDVFFGLDVWTDVKLVDENNILIRQVRANSYGEFLIPEFALRQNKPMRIEATCENAVVKLDLPPGNDELITETDIGILHLPNRRPSIEKVVASLGGAAVRQAPLGSMVEVEADASDPDGDTLNFHWGVVEGSGVLTGAVSSTIDWNLPTTLAGEHTLYVVAGDQEGGYTSMSLFFPVGAPGVTFSGRVINLSGVPLADAEISINGSVPVLSDALGGVYITVPESSDGRYIFNVNKPGYALLSHIYQTGVNDGLWRLIQADVRTVDPTKEIILEDKESELVRRFQIRSSRIIIPANTLVDSSGNRPTGTLTSAHATLDAGLEPIPGDYSAIRMDDSETSLVSYGAAFADFSDAAGTAFNNLALGSKATVMTPVNAVQLPTAPAEIPLWYYDETTGRWREEGIAALKEVDGAMWYVAEVEHFSTLNMDVAFGGNATCLRVSLGNTLSNAPTLRIHVPNLSGYPHGQDIAIDNRPIHAFFRLPLNAVITLEPRDNLGNPILAATRDVTLSNPPYPNSPDLEYDFPFDECGPLIILDIEIPPYYANPPGKSVFLTKEGPFGIDPSITGADLGNAYYAAVAPSAAAPARRQTLGEWWQVNGFDNTGNAAGQVQAHYFNANDLAFGREMHCLRNVGAGTLGCYVTNYADADDALNEIGPAATVAMEYAPVENEPTGTRIVKFFVYNGGDASAPRIPEINLDLGINANPANPQSSPIPVPYLCIVCHGGQNNYNPADPEAPTFAEVNMGANFREFDIETFRFPGGRDFNQLVQQSIGGPNQTGAVAELDAFKALNLLVRDHSGLSSPLIGELISGWYPGASNIPDVLYVPTVAPNKWDDTAATAQLYQQVYAPSCRACHVAQNDYRDFNSYDEFRNLRGAIYGDVCGPNRIMPNSRITYDNFWTSINPHRPGVLANFSGPGWTAFSADPATPCPTP